MNLGTNELTVSVLQHGGPERVACEQDAGVAGLPLPLPHRAAWDATRAPAKSWFFSFRDRQGAWKGGFAAEVQRSRALPGHLLLRCERFGMGLEEAARNAAALALRDLACKNGRILRVNVEIFSRDPAVQGSIDHALAGAGFQRVATPRRYQQTIALDLSPDEAGILASFHATARRHIRAIAKHPVAVRPLTSVDHVDRMRSLERETRERTGGMVPWRNWPAVLDLSRMCPTDSRVVGMFDTRLQGPESLLAFAWGCRQGAYSHYETAASTRATDLKVPLVYALVWDLVCWSRQQGAGWFDFGGITEGSHGESDPLGGISDFKRYFSKQIISVGGEWVLEPHWVRARLARVVSAGVLWLTARKKKLQER
jgi:hypothetical protein